MVVSDKRPIFDPWPGPWALWASRYCSNQSWRVVQSLGGYEDAMAECALLWCECRKRYGATVDNPAWFMRMYQLMVISRFNDLATKDRKIRLVEEQAWLMNITVQPEVDVSLKLEGASTELKEVIGVFLNAPRELYDGMTESLVDFDASLPHIFRVIANLKGISKSNVLKGELQQVLGNQRTRVRLRRRSVTATA